jgi:DNA-binding CsgD family transcriptional regulator
VASELFVGRVEERDTIRTALEAGRAGRSSVVWITGIAGSGKSALVRCSVTDVASDVTVVRAHGDEVAADVDGALLADLGVTPDRSVFATGLRVLERLTSAGSPTLVVIEDLQWVDATSRRALLVAIRRLDADSVVVVITTREEPVIADGWDDFARDSTRVQRLKLSPLSVAEVAELGARSGLELTADRARRLHEHTRGHALYVRTLLDELSASKVTDEHAYLPVPRTLAAATTSRIDALGPDSRALAAALAVLNQRTALPVAAHVADIAEPTAALQSLLATHLVVHHSADPQVVVEYEHPLYRQAVYESIDPLERQRMHRRAAEVVPPSASLAHRVAAADGLDDDLADELAAAAACDARSGRRAVAAKQLLWATSLRRDRLGVERDLVRAAELMLIDWRTSEAVTLRDRIVECHESPRRSLVLGMLAWQLGDTVTAEAALTAAAADGAPDVAAASGALLGRLHVYLQRGDEAETAGRRVLALQPDDHHVEVDAWTDIVVGVGIRDGPIRALEVLAERLPQRRADVAAEDVALLVMRGLLGSSALAVAEPAADFRTAIGIAGGDGMTRSHHHLAQTLYRAGEWDQAVAQARVALAIATDGGHQFMRPQIEATLAQLLAAQGEWTAAEAHIARAQRLAAATGMAESLFWTRIGAAALAFARSQPPQVIEQLGPISDQEAAEGTNALFPVDWWPMLVITRLDEGDIVGAELEQERFIAATARRHLNLPSFVAATRARIAHAKGDLPNAIEQFGVALETAGEGTPALERALLHHSYGEALRTASDGRQSIVQLRRAHDMLAELGAAPFRARAEATLHASGVRPRRSRDQRRFELTDRERDVAALVATGMTNKEVAANLYVSAKAIEYHLGNIFTKLGLSSRRELRAHAHALQATT